MWPNDAYGYDKNFQRAYGYDKNFQRQLDEAAEHQAHKERRPRTLKFATDKFYNFPIKHKKRNGK